MITMLFLYQGQENVSIYTRSGKYRRDIRVCTGKIRYIHVNWVVKFQLELQTTNTLQESKKLNFKRNPSQGQNCPIGIIPSNNPFSIHGTFFVIHSYPSIIWTWLRYHYDVLEKRKAKPPNSFLIVWNINYTLRAFGVQFRPVIVLQRLLLNPLTSLCFFSNGHIETRIYTIPLGCLLQYKITSTVFLFKGSSLSWTISDQD